MADAFTIQSNAADILRRFERLPNEVQGAVKRGFSRGLLLVEEEVKRRADLRLTGSRSGLASRLTSHVLVGGKAAVDGIIGFRNTRGFPYEMAQEYGATARAGGAMAIPISDEAKMLSQRGISAKDFPRKLFSRRTSRFLMEAVGGHALILHYIFVKSIPPRLHFRDSVEDNTDLVMREVVDEWEATY